VSPSGHLVNQAPAQSRALVKDLTEHRADRFDLRTGIRGAVLVLTPLVLGYALGLVEASVLVTLGTLELLFVEAPSPTATRWRTLAVGAVTNTLAFGGGTLLSRAPFVIEAPLAGLGIFAAFLVTRWPGWENVSFMAAVMLVLSLGIPVTSLAGEVLRPLAILLGGLWALVGISVYRLGRTRSWAVPAPAGPGSSSSSAHSWRSVAPHSAVVGITVAVGLVVGTQLGLARDYWIMLTIIAALRFDLSTTIAYSVARILGTVAGAAVAFVVTDATQDPWILFPILAAATALCLATRAVNYTLYAVWVTLTVIVLLNIAYSGGPSLAITRVIDTVIGGGLALLAAFVLWVTIHRRPAPSRTLA
jgi:uncharacterized membrane protein YccC